MSKKTEKEKVEIETIGAEKLPSIVSAIGLVYPEIDGGKKTPYFMATFYFNPPEPERHTHVVIARLVFDWEEGEDFAKELLEFIQKNKPK